MSPSRYPLRVNVGFLLHQSIGTSRDMHVSLDAAQLSDDFAVRELKGMARFTRTPQGLLLQGEFAGISQVTCARCLVDFEQRLSTTFSELYAFDERSVSESGLILPEDANIDLGPLVREYLLIEVPINPICRPDCKGLCSVCGQDLNLAACEHSAGL